MNGVLEFVLHHTIKSLTCALEQQYTKCKKYIQCDSPRVPKIITYAQAG